MDKKLMNHLKKWGTVNKKKAITSPTSEQPIWAMDCTSVYKEKEFTSAEKICV